MPPERRKHHRLPMDATTVQSAVISGRVLNLSVTGIAIETSSGLYIGRRHRLRVESADRVVVLDACVRWCRLQRLCHENGGDVVAIYRAGLKIGKTA